MEKKEILSIPSLKEMKSRGEKISCLTAYDYLTASLLDRAGIELVLVGDSAAMVFAGHETTLPATLDQMIYHTQCVSRGVKRALVITDMPFLSYQTSIAEAIRNAGRCLKEADADGVKLEGGAAVAETVRRLVEIGIPVMGHLGLTPQSVHAFGGYRLRGKERAEALQLAKDAKLLEEAGVFAIVLEKIPAALARKISGSLSIPTIGIGAGCGCDGQILVTPDLLGLYEEFKPKFVRRYAELAGTIKEAVEQYIRDVKDGTFPGDAESY